MRFGILLAIVSASQIYSFQFAAFKDFLELNNVKQSLIIVCDAQDILNMRRETKVIKSLWLSLLRVDQMGIENFHLPIRTTRTGLFLNMDCNASGRVITSASENSLFGLMQVWFLVSSNRSGIVEMLSSLDINVDSDITLAVRAKSSFHLYDIYKNCHLCGSAIISNYKGTYTTAAKFHLKPSYSKKPNIIHRHDFQQITMKAAIVITAMPSNISFSEYLETFNYRHLDLMHRKNYHILKMVAEMFNFRMLPIHTKEWGVFENGSWNGVVGFLLRHEVMFSITPLRFTLERVKEIYYLPETHVETTGFLFRHPQQIYFRNIFLQPFHSTSWYAVIAVGILAATLFIRILSYESVTDKSIASAQETSPSFAIFAILSALSLQGISRSFNADSSRIAIISIFTFSILLYQFYSAFILGSLLTESPRTLTTISALYNSKLKIGMEDIPYNHEFFNTTTDKKAKQFFSNRINKKNQNNILSLNEGLLRIKKGDFAFYVQLTAAYRILKEISSESEFYELQEVAMFTPFSVAPGVRKGSPFKEHLTHGILRIKETGILKYHANLWASARPNLNNQNLNKEVSVDLEHFLSAIALLGIGMILSTVIFLVEILFKLLKDYIKINKKFTVKY